MDLYAMTDTDHVKADTLVAALTGYYGYNYEDNEVYKEYRDKGYPVLVKERVCEHVGCIEDGVWSGSKLNYLRCKEHEKMSSKPRPYARFEHVYIGVQEPEVICKKSSCQSQKLVDLCFDLVLTATSDHVFCAKSGEEKAQWVADKLKECGFSTTPVGSSWGYLDGLLPTER